MSVWQHTTGQDYLRQSAEVKIEHSRLGNSPSHSAGGRASLVRKMAKVNCLQSVGLTPALGEISGDSFGGR